jgi:cbb3-type cytochrome oxidase subunit 3
MSNSPPICLSCTGNVNDLTGVTQLKKIERMIGDNYTLVFFSFVLLIILFLIIWYFGSQLKENIDTYRKAYIKLNDNVTKIEVAYDDSEIYNEDGEYVDTNKYFDKGKTDFVAKMKLAYKDYNKQKAEYIKNTYSTTDVDIIDTSAMYSKYDDY